MTDETSPNAPFNAATVPWDESFHGESFGGRWRSLSGFAGPQPYKIGFNLEELPPGRQSCPAHWHVREEEHIYILSGSMTVRIGQRRYIMGPGDYVRFPAGVAEEHAIFNHTDQPCTYIMVGDRDPDEVCVYPDSNKVSIRSQSLRFRRSDATDYWDGEDKMSV